MKAGETMENLATEIMRQNEAKTDYIVYAHDLLMEPCGDSLILHVLDDDAVDRIEPLDIGEYAHKQLYTYLNIPAKYYNRMLSEYPELLAENVNGWLFRCDAQRMLRVLDGRMRAFVSNRYLRIDHHEVSCAVLPHYRHILRRAVSQLPTDREPYVYQTGSPRPSAEHRTEHNDSGRASNQQ